MKRFCSTIGATLKPIRQNHNFTIYPLIWLDQLVNTSQQHINDQKLIRSSIDHLKVFDNVNKCEDYIRSISKDDRIILIINGRLVQEIVPRIHQLQQILSIYVYHSDTHLSEEWIKQYKKIKIIVTNVNHLIDKIRIERSKRSQNQVNEILLFSIFQTNTYHEQTNNIFNNQFIYSQLLIDALLQLRPMKNDKNKLVVLCKERYKDIRHELKLIQDFDLNYTSDKAIHWYMKDSVIYRIFNKALQIQNIDLLFLFRFFLHDIRQEIQQYQCTSPIRLYRGQLMTQTEMNLLVDSIGRLISINSFFTTYIHRELALTILNQAATSNDLERVMFEINTNPSTNSNKPFGFITPNNYFRQIEEVLFTLGSIFRLTKVHCQSDGLWIVQLTLCQDNDEQVNKIFQSFKTNQIDEKIDLVSLGNFLKKLGRLNEAEKFFTRLLHELSDNNKIIADCYYSLACIQMERNINDFSLNLHRKSLDIKLKTLKQNDLSLADSYNSIGQIYLRKSDYKQAFLSYYQALMITIEANGEDHLNVATCYTNLAGICQKQENYNDALKYHQKALNIRQQQLSIDQSDLGVTHNNIAIIYSCLGQYDLALEHYHMSLQILQKTLLPLHPEIAVSYCGLGLIYEQRGQIDQALSCYDKTAIIYRQALSPTHSHVIQIEEHIKKLSEKLPKKVSRKKTK